MHWPRRSGKTPYRDWATRQAQKGGRGGKETGKVGERQKTEGKGEGKKRAQSPFLFHPFYGRFPRRLTWKRGRMISQLCTRDCGVFNVPSWCMNWTSRSSVMNLYSPHIWWVWPAELNRHYWNILWIEEAKEVKNIEPLIVVSGNLATFPLPPQTMWNL